MALKFFAVLIVLGALWLGPQLARYRQWHAYDTWLARLRDGTELARVLLAVLLPTLVVLAIATLLRGSMFGDLLWLLFALLILGFCLGEVEPDVDAVLQEAEARGVAMRTLCRDAGCDESDSDIDLVEIAVMAALRRRFGVIFWFFVLGPAGAVLYRLAQRLAREGEPRGASVRLASALDWLPAHLMTLAMALASDFDNVARAWRGWHADPARRAWEFDPGFLAAVSRVDAEDEEESDDPDLARARSLRRLAGARNLLLRVLVLWMVVAALIVLAGWAG